MVKNKKGWLRVIEASISIILVLSFVLLVYFNNTKKTEEDLSSKLNPFLEEIALNNELRQKIIDYDTSFSNMEDSENDPENKKILDDINLFISSRITRKDIGFDVQICEPNQHCELYPYPDAGSIYSTERIISSFAENPNYKPKKIRLYLWETG